MATIGERSKEGQMGGGDMMKEQERDDREGERGTRRHTGAEDN
jgi:hypothetical protein